MNSQPQEKGSYRLEVREKQFSHLQVSGVLLEQANILLQISGPGAGKCLCLPSAIPLWVLLSASEITVKS